MRISLILLAFFTLMMACGPSQTVENKAEEPKVIENEDDLLTRLSMQLIANPRSQAQKDQNEIIDYAIGELLEVQSTKSGLFYQLLIKGDEKDIPPRSGDIIYVHYTGSFLDGKVFDKTTKDEPLKIKLLQVIPGWQEALPMLRKGGKGIFLIPSHLGYGEEGFGKHVPSNTVLKFEMEIINIDRY